MLDEKISLGQVMRSYEELWGSEGLQEILSSSYVDGDKEGGKDESKSQKSAGFGGYVNVVGRMEPELRLLVFFVVELLGKLKK